MNRHPARFSVPALVAEAQPAVAALLGELAIARCVQRATALVSLVSGLDDKATAEEAHEIALWATRSPIAAPACPSATAALERLSALLVVLEFEHHDEPYTDEPGTVAPVGVAA